MRPFRTALIAAGASAVLALALPAAPVTAAPLDAGAASGAGGIPAKARRQIDALAKAKQGRTPAERKIDSRLLAELAQRRGRDLVPGVDRVLTGVVTDKAGRTPLTVHGDATKVTAAVRAVSGRVLGVYAAERAVRADVPLTALPTLAASSAVTAVRVADQPLIARQGGRVPPLSKERRAAVVAQRVAAALARAKAQKRALRTTDVGLVAEVGARTSEGDRAHAADTARQQFGVTGTAIKVGVLSDGVDSLAASIASGDAPPDTEVLPGEAGSGDEGTAMIEIVHDLAPKAKIAFATAFTSAESFATNIRKLREAGCDIIVDDVLYYAEPPFQDGPVAQAVIDVTNDGALYFSSAGNENNVDDRTAGNWEGDFSSSGLTLGKFAGYAHDFDPGPGVQALNPVSADSAGVAAILQWADPLGASGNDYDLYAVGTNGTVTAFSNDVQDGNDRAFEGFFIPSGTLGLVVTKFRGEDRYFQLTPFRGRFTDRAGLIGYNTPGVTRGHSAVPAAFSVAAVPAAQPFPREIAPGVPNPSGPYPGSFTSAQQSETFTSDGPRRVFFRPDGTPITPGNFTSTGGEVRLKPDVAAADGVSTTVPGFEKFYGSSASAPHAAAIAALVLSGNPGIAPAEVRGALTGTALDIEQPGWDTDTGYGIVMADRVLDYTGATPQPLVVPGEPTVTATDDGDTYLEPGESGTLSVPVTNVGDGSAQSVSVQLTTTSPGVTIQPIVRRYGEVAPDATARQTFTVTVPASWEPGVPLDLRIRVSFVGVRSPQIKTVSLPIGQPGPVTDFAYAGPPVQIPDGDPAGAAVPIPVSGLGRVSRITFSIDGTECTTAEGATTVGLDHTFVADLVGTLKAPDGTEVTLFARPDGGGNNFCQTVFDDSAGRSIASVTSAEAPFTGTWRPASPLSAFHGRAADGTWTFTARDTLLADTGSIRAVSLHVAGYLPSGG